MKAIATARRIAHVPEEYEIKAHLLRTAAAPQGLYGNEAAPIPDSWMRRLRAAFVNAIRPSTVKHSNAAVFSSASHGPDVDPDVEQLKRKATRLRRTCAKQPRRMQQVNTIYQKYKQIGYVGIYHDGTDLEKLQPAPPPGDRARGAWKAVTAPQGPIGLFLQALHCIAAALKDDWTIHKFREEPFNIFRCPWQQLKHILPSWAIHARTQQASETRACLRGTTEYDDIALASALAAATHEEQRITTYVASGGATSQVYLESFGAVDSTKCRLCGGPHQDIDHTIWECAHPTLQAARRGETAEDTLLASIPIQCIPPSLRIGLPPALQASPTHAFWGEHSEAALWPAEIHAPGELQTLLGCTSEHLTEAQWNAIRTELPPHMQHANARQQLRSLIGHAVLDLNHMPEFVNGVAPIDPNAFSDGSLTDPNAPRWALPSAAAWYPLRCTELSDMENAYAEPFQTMEGLEPENQENELDMQRN